MDYPEAWTKTVTLENGVDVFLRPELSSDTDMLWEMFSTLSKASVDNLIPPFTREKIESWTRDIDYNRHLPILAFVREGDSDRIIGSASLSFHPQDIYRHKADLGITVHDDYHDLGLGTAMIRHLLDIARRKGLQKVSLIGRTDNRRAIHVYEKCGFTIEAKREKARFQDGRFIDEYIMTVFL